MPSDLPAPRRIVTVTLNPALDLSTSARAVEPGKKLRCAPANEDPGGGGVNVSRAVQFLGGHSLAMVALGGATGERLLALLHDEHIAVTPIPAAGETRRSLSVISAADGAQYRFLLPGPAWDPAAVERALRTARAGFGPGDLAVISGSLPPGAPPEMALRLARAAVEKGARAVLDTSGAALAAAATARGAAGIVLRMDDEEAAELAGTPIASLEDLADFAAVLQARCGFDAVIMAAGAAGSVMATGEGRLHARPPKVEVVSKVGAGDSFVGAFSLLLAQAGAGSVPAAALVEGVAAAAAAVTTPDTRLCTAEDVARLRPGVALSAI